MTGLAWPTILQPSDFGFALADVDTSGGLAVGGGEQFVVSAGPRWTASMTLRIRNSDQVLALRALRSGLHGRAVAVQLPNFDDMRLPWPVSPIYGRLSPYYTRDRGLDGTAYEEPAIPTESAITATVNADALIRATTLAINKTQGGTIRAGHQFGIGERLYEIISVVSTVGAVTTVTISPPLRAAHAAGITVKFTNAICLMRCLNLNDQSRLLVGRKFATLGLEFLEYI
jgi:hypothetical protein